MSYPNDKTCKDCPAYAGIDAKHGSCRCNPPVYPNVTVSPVWGVYPLVPADSWCYRGRQIMAAADA